MGVGLNRGSQSGRGAKRFDSGQNVFKVVCYANLGQALATLPFLSMRKVQRSIRMEALR
jgi:hypothetical protein